jgi:hypothetical protein
VAEPLGDSLGEPVGERVAPPAGEGVVLAVTAPAGEGEGRGEGEAPPPSEALPLGECDEAPSGEGVAVALEEPETEAHCEGEPDARALPLPPALREGEPLLPLRPFPPGEDDPLPLGSSEGDLTSVAEGAVGVGVPLAPPAGESVGVGDARADADAEAQGEGEPEGPTLPDDEALRKPLPLGGALRLQLVQALGEGCGVELRTPLRLRAPGSEGLPEGEALSVGVDEGEAVPECEPAGETLRPPLPLPLPLREGE